MREDYVKLVKEQILSNPDYKYTINELKTTLLSYGVTQQEFDQALEELTDPSLTPSIESPMLEQDNNKRNNINDKFIPFLKQAMILNAITILFIFLGGLFFVFWVYFDNKTNNSASGVATSINIKRQNSLATQVYANTIPIDSKRIFSYPTSNVTLTITGTPRKEVLGFLPYWMLPSQNQISLNGITSVALFGLDTDANGNIVTVQSNGTADGGWTMWNSPLLNTFINRAKARKIKIELTLKCFSNKDIEKLINSNTAQETFISNAIQLIDSKSLDGINIDFEYVGTPNPGVRDAFTRFIINLNTALKRQLPNAILTVDSYINSAATPGIFDIPEVAKNVNAIVIMGYDMHTPLGSPGPIAPMEGNISIIGYMQAYLEEVSPEKLILAVPYYGYDWTVGSANPKPAQVLPYAQIIATSKNDTIQWNDTSQTPWYSYVDPATNITHNVYFENTRSLGIKYDYVNRKNLKGIGIWALGYDGLNADLRELILEKFAD